jgi:hypothetical protein
MSNNPIQVVLNTRDFFVVPDPGRMGYPKDFFESRDKEFTRHRNTLSQQVASITTALQQSSVDTAFVKVRLTKEAWAKSHRPTQALFPPAEFPCVGASRLGELFFQVTPRGLQAVEKQILSAETETTWKERPRDGKRISVPSHQRSEVGAIQEIALPVADDKRSFDTRTAVNWLTDPRTSGAYLVELFDLARATRDQDQPAAMLHRRALRFMDRMKGTNLSIDLYPFRVFKPDADDSYARVLAVRLVLGPGGVNYLDYSRRVLAGRQTAEIAPFDSDVRHHGILLEFLDRDPMVRRVSLPPLLLPSASVTSPLGRKPVIPKRGKESSYPRIGVIDSGVGDVFENWVIGRSDLLDPSHKAVGHGTFIAGLLIAGRSLNGDRIAPEPDGCEIYDGAIFPDKDKATAFASYYPLGAKDFLAEIANTVAVAKQQHGVRVFNLSINVISPVDEDQYGPFAEQLDAIADEHDIVFVISAGNLRLGEYRPIWPAKPEEALKMLAARSVQETIFQSCESSRSLAVGALTPPGAPPHIGGTPACYSRRGPGLKVGVKPDLAHYGGCVPTATTNHCGLFSIDPSGMAASGLGTSYAAPLVAKAVATLDASIEGYVSREMLLALTVHNARIPEPIAGDDLREIARQFVGFGVPSPSDGVLTTDDSSITLVFSDVLMEKRELRFDFAWPRCLVDRQTGRCRGDVRMTLVYRPPLEPSFGSELVRVNLDAHLRQDDGTGKYVGQLKQVFLPDPAADANTEAELIEHGLKWWPIKGYHTCIPRGVGKSSNWRLAIDSLVRAGDHYPSDGIAFALVLSICDPRQGGRVFNDLRQYLQARGVSLNDIRIAGRVRPRV